MKNLLFALIALSLFSVSCAHHHHKYGKKEGLALITPVNKSKAHGYVRFKKLDCGQVLVTAQVAGLKPGTKHGFHIHQYGDCREQGRHAGPHLNPDKNQHGSPDDEEKHAGDLGNLIAGPKGIAVYKKTVNMCLRKAGGRAVIIHAGEDDLKSQPSGNSGAYIGCGVIGYVKPEKPAQEKAKPAGVEKKLKKPEEAKKKPAKPKTAKPEETKKKQPAKPKTAKPEETKKQPAKPKTAKPEETKKKQPAKPKTAKPEETKKKQPAKPKTAKPEETKKQPAKPETAKAPKKETPDTSSKKASGGKE